MRETDHRRRPTIELETQRGAEHKQRSAVIERSEAHRRWIDDDVDDPACRGID